MPKHDERIVYGARCTWWDSIDEAGAVKRASGHNLPACPHCGSLLFEVDNLEKWTSGLDRYDTHGHPGYRAMVEWGRGQCFKNYDALKAAYEARRA